MNQKSYLNNLFSLLDSLIGDISSFKGLSFELDHGIFFIDFSPDHDLFICKFHPFTNEEGDITMFTAVGVDELKDQISEYVLL